MTLGHIRARVDSVDAGVAFVGSLTDSTISVASADGGQGRTALELYHTGDGAIYLHLALRWHEFDEDRFEKAFDALLERHQSLRSRRSGIDSAIAAIEGRKQVHRVGHWKDEPHLDQIERRLTEVGMPPLLATIYSAGRDAVLILSADHAVCDYWSANLLVRDLLNIYAFPDCASGAKLQTAGDSDAARVARQ